MRFAVGCSLCFIGWFVVGGVVRKVVRRVDTFKDLEGSEDGDPPIAIAAFAAFWPIWFVIGVFIGIGVGIGHLIAVFDRKP